jgi:hypothetical protein
VTTTTKTKKPPKKLSALLQLAYNDLRKCERSKKYVIDMVQWFLPVGKGVCHVCMAGAVMAQKKLADENAEFEVCPSQCGAGWDGALRAIDNLREGNMVRAFREMFATRPLSIPQIVDMADYHKDRPQFGRDIRKLIKMLKDCGQ